MKIYVLALIILLTSINLFSQSAGDFAVYHIPPNSYSLNNNISWVPFYISCEPSSGVVSGYTMGIPIGPYAFGGQTDVPHCDDLTDVGVGDCWTTLEEAIDFNVVTTVKNWNTKIDVTDTVGLTNGWSMTKYSADTRYKAIGYVPAWTEITGKPSTFNPSAHSHAPSDIVSAPWLTSEVDGSTTNEIELPSQTGQSGKVLSTNGSTTSWVTDAGSIIDKGSTTFSGITLTTQYTVTHGLGYTPTSIWIQPRSANAAAVCYTDNYTSTTFRITFITVPILGTNNITFDWFSLR